MTIREELTEKEEHYCQLRSSGYNKTDAADIAYETKYPNRLGWTTEQKDKIKDRIRELKEERAECFGLDADEQVRRYNELYFMALREKKLGLAKEMLQRLDVIGGFEAPKKSESVVTRKGDALKNVQGDVKKDLNKFSKILGTHVENLSSNVIIDDSDSEDGTSDTKH